MKHEVEEMSGAATRERSGTREGAGKPQGDRQEMMRKMEAAATPGPGHKVLDALAGQWKAEVKCWQEPGGQAQVTQGTAKTGWILNGHFLEEEFRGEMMGRPFTGRSIMGFDNLKQTFNTVWISDSQTSIMCSEGRGDAANKVITLEGRTSCPATGRTDLKVKTVFRILSSDKHIFEMYDESRGANAKAMEITYTRQ